MTRNAGFAASIAFGNGTGGLNPQTVARDTARSQLFGGAGSDWLWFTDTGTSADLLTGFTSGEVATFE